MGFGGESAGHHVRLYKKIFCDVQAARESTKAGRDSAAATNHVDLCPV